MLFAWQILTDFFAVSKKNQLEEKEKYLGIDFHNVNHQLKFKNAALTRIGNIKGIETLVEEKVIQNLFFNIENKYSSITLYLQQHR
ncbi:MAG: hypothetical protein JWM09_646 [Francisellaceae bacterium]|nr:hypothetical protein [Francisellaceae bacterium]